MLIVALVRPERGLEKESSFKSPLKNFGSENIKNSEQKDEAKNSESENKEDRELEDKIDSPTKNQKYNFKESFTKESVANEAALIRACVSDGWRLVRFSVDGQERFFLWKSPTNGPWENGAILVAHGGGGEAAHFCAGGALVKPQIAFAKEAISSGFAVFLLEATTDIVTDEEGRTCGKRFDFSFLPRKNIDLPYLEAILKDFIPLNRPIGAKENIFMTGLSTGGYMTTRAGSTFSEITAFAPVSAGDPYATDTICDSALSSRTSAKGILVDHDTKKQIIEIGACQSSKYERDGAWPTGRGKSVLQLHHEGDGIVDISCMKKAKDSLARHGFSVSPPFVVSGSKERSATKHLWLAEYNQPIIDFFKNF